jgi:hypothetical protein
MKLKSFSLGISVAYLMLSCNPNEILEPELDANLYQIINGDTIKVRSDQSLGNFGINTNPQDLRIFYGDTTVHFKKYPVSGNSTKKPNISKIKNISASNQPFRMIAVGGAVAAGVRDGGYFNEGLETSFPNLIANQMGVDFKQPYFSAEDYNGYGRAVPTNLNLTGGPVPKFKEVSNNTAYLRKGNNGDFELKPFLGERNDNFSTPEFTSFDTDLIDDNNVYIKSIAFKRFKNIDQETKTPTEIILKEKFDFIIVADGLGIMQNFIVPIFDKISPKGFEGYENRKPKGGADYRADYSSRLNFLLQLIDRKGLKGLMFTIPNSFKFPYTHWVKREDVLRQLDLYGKRSLFLEDIKTILPTSKIDSLMGKNVNVNLKPFINDNKKFFYSEGSIEDEYNINYIINRNNETINVAKSLDFAVVDLYIIYENIFNSIYTTHDGIKITSKEFFSSDGIHPSVIGQVVIANESITAINKYYGLEIPLLSTRDFLK